MSDLGNLRGEYHGTPWRFISVAVLTGLLTIGAIWAVNTMRPPDPWKAWLVVVGLGALTAIFAFTAIRDRGTRLRVHDRGVIYARGAGETVVAYSDVAAVRERQINHKPVALILALRRGGEVTITAHLDGYAQAARTIANAIGR